MRVRLTKNTKAMLAVKPDEISEMSLYSLDIQRSCVLLTALANAHRIHIVRMLMAGERDVTSIGQELGLGQSPVSQHLKRLREANIVKTRRQAQTIYYSLRTTDAARLIQAMEEIFPLRKAA